MKHSKMIKKSILALLVLFAVYAFYWYYSTRAYSVSLFKDIDLNQSIAIAYMSYDDFDNYTLIFQQESLDKLKSDNPQIKVSDDFKHYATTPEAEIIIYENGQVKKSYTLVDKQDLTFDSKDTIELAHYGVSAAKTTKPEGDILYSYSDEHKTYYYLLN